MVSLRSSKKMTLSATDEFWHSPILSDSPSPDAGNDHEQPTMSLPSAHHQLLSVEQTSFENLKGYDHTASVPNVDFDGYSSSSDEGESSSSNSWCARQKLSAVKQQGGGSWLLGFARLNDKTVSNPVEEEDEDMTPPGLVRDDSSLDSDEDSASTASTDVDSDEDDDDSVSKPASSSQKRRRSGVSFSESVTVQPIPHSSTLSPMQRRKMYSTSWEVRQNKIRNKKEYRYDGYDWRNVTEEWEMGVDMVTGELVHPAHEH